MPTVVEPEVAFARPDIGQAEIEAVSAALASGWLTSGPRVEEFERRFADYVGAPHACAVPFRRDQFQNPFQKRPHYLQ